MNFGCFGFGYGEKREMMYLREYWERARNICFERRGHAIEVMDGTMGFGLFRFGYEEMEREKSQKTDL